MRRILHVASAAVLLLLPLGSWSALRAVLLVAAGLAVGLEAGRLGSPRVHGWLSRALPVFRSTEVDRPSGAMWLAVGYGLAALFPAPAPAMAILVGAIADPAASWVGSVRRTEGRKTLRGSAGHLAVSLGLLVLAGLPWDRAAVVAVIGTALERWSGPVDDNLLVPPGVAAAVTLLA